MDAALTVDVEHRLSRLDLRAQLTIGRETLALVGPSGAGKTSLVRVVAGLLTPRSGRIALRDSVWLDTARGVNVPPERRRVGMLFQHLALFPHLSVAANVAYGIRARGRPKAERLRAVAQTLERFGIARLAQASPASLSGGERQRVALARAVAADPAVLLLDEPLAALDAETKRNVGLELHGHLRSFGLPAVLVSHDFEDVVGLAERIAVMEGGRIVQMGSAADLLQAPASSFVAAFTGVNYFAGMASSTGGLTQILPDAADAIILSTDPGAGRVAVVVYPWEVALSLGRPDGSALNSLSGEVGRVVGMGNRVRVTVKSRPPIVAEITEESARRMSLAPGVPVVASWKATGTKLVPGGGSVG